MMVAAKWIPKVASSVFFMVIVLQVPFFRVPRGEGSCTSPLEVMTAQMAGSDAIPRPVIKGLLFPGAVFRHLFRRDSLVPVWGNLLQEYNLTADGVTAWVGDKFRLEVVAGSYFAVGGAVVSLIRPGRMPLLGVLLIIWGLIKDGKFQKENAGKDHSELVKMEPMLFFGLALALLSIRFDMKKVERIGAPIARPLRSSTKSKLKKK